MKKLYFLFALVLAACQGPAGSPGLDGRDGSGLVAEAHCIAQPVVLPLNDPNSGLPFGFLYDQYTFADGSKFVSCEINSGYAAEGGLHFLKKGAQGTAEGVCVINKDLTGDFGGFFVITLGRSAQGVQVATARYSDSGAPFDGGTVPLACQ
jgi:hypothetical protein